ncbi:MAG: T9SS type A sorting domain-containing protein [Segetibacter sp.]
MQFTNMEKGRYSVVLYNTLGQKLYSSTIEHTARSGTYTISLGRLISKGTYTLHISKGDTTMNERVIVE